MLEEEKQYSQQYIESHTPVVGRVAGSEQAFFRINGKLSQRTGEGREWEPLGQQGEEAHILLSEDGNLLVWQRPWTLLDGLPKELQQVVPGSLQGSLGGYYTVSTLPLGPFRFLNIELSREQLLPLLGTLRPDTIAVVEKLEESSEVVVHPVGDAYGEWCTIFFRGAEPLLQREYEGLRVTLYRAIHAASRWGARVMPELYVGFQGLNGPEWLLTFELAQGGTHRAWWSADDLWDVLNRQERYFHLGEEPVYPTSKKRNRIDEEDED